ncbi:MAG: hypothetical protein OXR67_15850 [Chloroflexota bacterium]|nr:hypothetical protein [Chloroflexota bacterium]
MLRQRNHSPVCVIPFAGLGCGDTPRYQSPPIAERFNRSTELGAFAEPKTGYLIRDFIRDFGGDGHHNFAEIPFYLFSLTVMFDP